VVERLHNVVRHFYRQEVIFVIPDRAMSAGTIWALSGDRLMMNYFSSLSPIDPQLQKGDHFVPALSYLQQFEAMQQKAQLTHADIVLLSKLDLAELHHYGQAKKLSIDLLQKWLATYKFKDWNETETRKLTVTREMRQKRAEEIAEQLNDTGLWFSHGRNIGMETVQNVLNLKVEDFDQKGSLGKLIESYSALIADHIYQHETGLCIHTREYFL
jgi:G3E family GTPase